MKNTLQIGLTPKLSSTSGPASFQIRLSRELQRRGMVVDIGLTSADHKAILVIGGTRKIGELSASKRRNVRIVQRLDGINWIHRVRWTGVRHFIKAEYGNLILRWIRNRIADAVVYQSDFAREWWHRNYTPAPVTETVIHNAVDLQEFHPDGEHERPNDRFRVLLVEGSLRGGYEVGLEHALELMSRVQRLVDEPVELQIVGQIRPQIQHRFAEKADFPIRWSGEVKRSDIPFIDRSAHVLFSADLNPACPNAAIEALACGLPVIGLDTGALAELVTPEAGRVTHYGGDPWKLHPPELEPLSMAAVEVHRNQVRFRAGARARAKTAFGITEMADRYLDVLVN